MKEPERKEEGAVEEHVLEPQVVAAEAFAAEPKAYAFDGWAMVPLELDPV